MADILTIIAAVEWIVVGTIAAVGLHRWNKRFEALFDELDQSIEADQGGTVHDGD